MPADGDWQDRAPTEIDRRLRSLAKQEAGPRLLRWEERGWVLHKSIARLGPDARYHLSATAVLADARQRMGRELLLLVGQAEEIGATWTAIAQALATSPQNAHKAYARRLMTARTWAAEGMPVESILDNL